MPVPTTPTREIVKEALLVGVSYASNHVLKTIGLRTQPGAHNDTMELRHLLTSTYGYKDEDITTLVDAKGGPPETQPTRKNIIEGMKKLISGKQAGDHIVFSFSGHGCQIEALIEGEEDDGMDEILLPVDVALDVTFDPQSPEYFINFIRDNEIREIFVDQLASGVHCSLIFDCCHSGTASDLPNVLVQSPVMTPDSPFFSVSSPRSTAPPRAPGSFARMNTLHDGHLDDTAPYMWSTARSGYSLHIDMGVTSWSACLDDQITFGRRSGGIFMKAFTQTLASNPNPTHRELLRELRKNILRVTDEENKKLKDRREARGVLPRESPLLEDFVAPRPQLGSDHPDSILLVTFAL